jgi:hypothetical protein
LGFTVNVTVAEFEQPLLVPVTEYTVVVVGLTVYELLDPSPLQLYVDAPVTEIVELSPLHIVPSLTEATTFGNGVTLTVTVATSVQPLLVPVTV